MPKTICHECFNKIIAQFSFIKNYRKVQKLLLEISKNKKIVDEVQEKTNSSEIENISFIDELSSSDEDEPLSSLYNKQKNKEVSVIKTSTNLKNDGETLKNLNVYNCKWCDINFDHEKELESHRKLCGKKEEETFPCKNFNHLEGKYSQSSRNNIKNLISKHSCNDCNESFEFIKQLEKHCKELSHNFPRRFICDVCSKNFLSNTRLNYHMRTHNNERPYTCNECGMSFTLSSNLKRHKKRHTGEKSYFCEICGKGKIL